MEKLIKNNAAQLLDVLGGRLAFERTGVKLYDTVIHKIESAGEPRYHRLLDQLRHIRGEEKEHEEWLEEQIRACGGHAGETTTMSQLETEESQGIEKVIMDGHQKVLHLLHALLAAELADNAGWDLLVKLATETGDRAAKRAFMKRMLEEVQHLAFIRAAVITGAKIELLGRDEQLPKSLSGAMTRSAKRPLAFGGLLAGAIAATFLARRRSRGWRARLAALLPS